MAVALVVCSLYLMRAEWSGGPQPANVVGPFARKKAWELYQKDLMLQKEAEKAGIPYEPKPGHDPLEEALAYLDEAVKIVPLDRQLSYLQGYIGLHFDDLNDKSMRAFSIERMLDPKWVESPMRQALAWSRKDINQTEILWRDALQRAEWMDRHHSASYGNRKRVKEEIMQVAKGHPDLEAIAVKLDL